MLWTRAYLHRHNSLPRGLGRSAAHSYQTLFDVPTKHLLRWTSTNQRLGSTEQHSVLKRPGGFVVDSSHFCEENHSSPTYHGVPIEPNVAHSGYSLSLPLKELPKLPSRPSYPCPWLSKNEVDSFIVPLVARGWRVAQHDGVTGSLVFGKKFVFCSALDMESFAERLGVLMDKAHHHGIVRRAGPHVLLYQMNTHSAMPPADHEAESQTETPGITALDVRLAIRLERLWEEYVRSGRAERAT